MQRIRPQGTLPMSAAALVCALLSLFVARVGIPLTVRLPTERISPSNNRSFYAETGLPPELADSNEAPRRSTLRLFEDGVPLGPGHSTHDSIAISGGGAFSHWAGVVYFSSSDNSDPRKNGRSYVAEIRRTGGTLNAWLGPILLCVAIALALSGRPKTKALLWAGYLLFLLGLGPGMLLFLRSNELLDKIRASVRRFDGLVHRPDPVLGARPIPGSHAVWTYPGNRYEVTYDETGLRSGARPIGGSGNGRKVLFLGCSFTWGDGVEGDETFALSAGRLAGARGFNAGFPGYGYSQMVLLARRLIPTLKPDQVVVQLSPWLADRARSLLLPSLYGAVPGPYLSDRRPGEVTVETPVFTAADEFSQDLRAYQDAPLSLGLRTRFAFGHGMKWVFHDAWGTLRSSLAVRADPGRAPTAVSDDRLTAGAVAAIGEVAKENGASLVLLKLTFAERDRGLANILNGNSEGTLVDGDAALKADLGAGEEFNRAYMHWSGNPAVLVDMHPNARAHGVLARALAPALTLPSPRATPRAQP